MNAREEGSGFFPLFERLKLPVRSYVGWYTFRCSTLTSAPLHFLWFGEVADDGFLFLFPNNANAMPYVTWVRLVTKRYSFAFMNSLLHRYEKGCSTRAERYCRTGNSCRSQTGRFEAMLRNPTPCFLTLTDPVSGCGPQRHGSLDGEAVFCRQLWACFSPLPKFFLLDFPVR